MPNVLFKIIIALYGVEIAAYLYAMYEISYRGHFQEMAGLLIIIPMIILLFIIGLLSLVFLFTRATNNQKLTVIALGVAYFLIGYIFEIPPVNLLLPR